MFSRTVSVIGGIDCFSNDSLEQLASKAVQLYGDGRNISVASVGNIGTIIGQFFNSRFFGTKILRQQTSIKVKVKVEHLI